MEKETGKLFIGGISWDTSEDRLRQYFEKYGDVIEAVIMKDRVTGRARGFGFVVYADPSVADLVVLEKHIIDGRTVEAKKAVPRDDQNSLTKSNGSMHSSPGPIRTKKIFVGGLASNVTESDFKKYFDQFGTITDVVVMYDHNTQRPRGFGFITYDSEEAVERVLYKTFHELNSKMVEVKRAVPKQLSPGPNRGQLVGSTFGINRGSNFLNGYIEGCNPSLVGGHGIRMDERISSLLLGRSGYPAFGPNYATGHNLEPVMKQNTNFIGDHIVGRQINSLFTGSSNRYSTDIGYSPVNGVSNPSLNSSIHSLWGDGGLTGVTRSLNSGPFVGYGSDSRTGTFGSIGTIRSSTQNSGLGAVGSTFSSQDGSYGSGNINFGLGSEGYGRKNGAIGAPALSNATPRSNYSRDSTDDFDLGLFNGKSAWLPSPVEMEKSGLLGYGFGNMASEFMSQRSTGLIGT